MKWRVLHVLIHLIKSRNPNLEIVLAPAPDEIEQARSVDAVLITNNNLALNIMELSGLILKSNFVIANDTGPAHIAAHLGKEGVVLFGHHTTAKKVSIETNKFHAVTVKNLNDLSAEKVYSEIEDKIKLIN